LAQQFFLKKKDPKCINVGLSGILQSFYACNVGGGGRGEGEGEGEGGGDSLLLGEPREREGDRVQARERYLQYL
jgi:hypothetical protein